MILGHGQGVRMSPNRARPPAPGGPLLPNFLTVEEALSEVTFPISKRELMREVEDATALFQGRNVDLRVLIRDLADDYFDSEDELHEALEHQYGEPGADGGHDEARGAKRRSATGKDAVEDAYGQYD